MSNYKKALLLLSPWVFGWAVGRLVAYDWGMSFLLPIGIVFLLFWIWAAQFFYDEKREVLPALMSQNIIVITAMIYLLGWRLFFQGYPLGIVSVLAQNYFLPVLRIVGILMLGGIGRFLPSDPFLLSGAIMFLASWFGIYYQHQKRY